MALTPNRGHRIRFDQKGSCQAALELHLLAGAHTPQRYNIKPIETKHHCQSRAAVNPQRVCRVPLSNSYSMATIVHSPENGRNSSTEAVAYQTPLEVNKRVIAPLFCLDLSILPFFALSLDTVTLVSISTHVDQSLRKNDGTVEDSLRHYGKASSKNGREGRP